MGVIDIPVEIQKVLELEGAFRQGFHCPVFVYAHISKPIKKDGREVQYALMAICPQHGMMDLGDINQKTRAFEVFEPRPGNPALYERASNHVVKRVMVPSNQLSKLRTLDDILSINGISVKKEFIPGEYNNL